MGVFLFILQNDIILGVVMRGWVVFEVYVINNQVWFCYGIFGGVGSLCKSTIRAKILKIPPFATYFMRLSLCSGGFMGGVCHYWKFKINNSLSKVWIKMVSVKSEVLGDFAKSERSGQSLIVSLFKGCWGWKYGFKCFLVEGIFKTRTHFYLGKLFKITLFIFERSKWFLGSILIFFFW